MEITVDELKGLNSGEYVLYDIRNKDERNYGFIPESVAVTAEELPSAACKHKDKKLIIYCARGIVSLDAAKRLCKEGFEAYSLKDGYISWLRSEMQSQNAKTLCENTERSLRKKFKSTILSKFTKALKIYKLVNEGDKVAVCISGGKVRF